MKELFAVFLQYVFNADGGFYIIVSYVFCIIVFLNLFVSTKALSVHICFLVFYDTHGFIFCFSKGHSNLLLSLNIHVFNSLAVFAEIICL